MCEDRLYSNQSWWHFSLSYKPEEKTKVGEFNTQQECWEALISGKWLVDDELIVKLTNGYLTDGLGNQIDAELDRPHVWSTYVRPKTKKIVKLAPSLTRGGDGRYYITNSLHEYEEEAKDFHCLSFVRWLIDTPYEISIGEEEGLSTWREE